MKAWKFGDDVNTDVIIPARYLTTSDPEKLAKHCMEDSDNESFKRALREYGTEGDVIVAGKNFGCGSSREHAPIAIRGAGIRCVIGESFARIFYRNAFNIGLPILECPEASERIAQGDELEINMETGEIKNLTRGEVYKAKPIPEFMRSIIESGGLMEMVRKRYLT